VTLNLLQFTQNTFNSLYETLLFFHVFKVSIVELACILVR